MKPNAFSCGPDDLFVSVVGSVRERRHPAPLSLFTAIITIPFLAYAGIATALSPVPPTLLNEGYYDGAEFHLTRPVAPGVEHEFDSFSTGPLTINTVTVDTSAPGVIVEAVKAKDKMAAGETPDKMMERIYRPDRRPIVAINADFWDARHVPVGLYIGEGAIWKNPWGQRSVFAFDDQGHYRIGPAEWSVALKKPGSADSLAIDIVNCSLYDKDTTHVLAYTWPHGDASPEPKPGQTKVVLSLPSGEWLPNAPAPVTVRSVGEPGTTALDHKTVVLLLDSKPASWVKPGAHLVLDARFGGLPGKVIGALGGVPELLKDGKVDVFQAARRERIRKSFVTDHHPRTAVGIKADGKTVVIVVVDGRQPGRSIGISLTDLAEWMKKQGCVDAMNFDGGGSTCMDVRNEVVNFPSDSRGPRPVSNFLVACRTAPIGPLAQLKIQPRNAILPPGLKVDLKAQGLDAGYDPVSLLNWTLTWRAVGKDTRINANGVLSTGKEPGSIQVEVTASPANDAVRLAPGAPPPSASTQFTVAQPEKIEVFPSAVLLETGDAVNIRFQGTTADGKRFLSSPAIWEVTVPPFLRFVPAEGRLKAVGAGTGYLTARLGPKSERIPVAVDRFKETLAYSFDTLPSSEMGKWIKAVHYTPSGTSVVLDKSDKKQGAASWKFTYAMARGGVTKIALPIHATLPGKPLAVGLWVRGDGKKQWFRGELRDADNHGYYLDFTNATTGIDWSGEWKFVQASLVSPTAMAGYHGAMKPPYTLKTIYVAQGNEAEKENGQILIDGLFALNLPESLQAPNRK